jgi:large subunit ribosomal protein L25
VLEHVTREITVEALPTEIPEQLVADVSEMEINDTLTLSSVPVPEGVKLMAEDLDEITIATLSHPRVEEEPEPDVEEEAELVGEEGEEPAAGEGADDEGQSGGDSGDSDGE